MLLFYLVLLPWRSEIPVQAVLSANISLPGGITKHLAEDGITPPNKIKFSTLYLQQQ